MTAVVYQTLCLKWYGGITPTFSPPTLSYSSSAKAYTLFSSKATGVESTSWAKTAASFRCMEIQESPWQRPKNTALAVFLNILNRTPSFFGFDSKRIISCQDMPPWIRFWHGFFVTFVINHFFQQDGNGHIDQHDALESAGTSCTNINQANNRNVETYIIYIYIKVLYRGTFPSLITSCFASTHQHSLCLPTKISDWILGKLRIPN